jgi:hypothetical protein
MAEWQNCIGIPPLFAQSKKWNDVTTGTDITVGVVDIVGRCKVQVRVIQGKSPVPKATKVKARHGSAG